MADIKTRQVITGTIKTLDRSVVASHRIKDAFVYAKDAADRSTGPEESQNAETYASSKIENTIKEGSRQAVHGFHEAGKNP